MDPAKHDPSFVAKVPTLSGGVRGDRDGSRAFSFDCGQYQDAVNYLVRRLAFLFCSQATNPLHGFCKLRYTYQTAILGTRRKGVNNTTNELRL